MTFSARIVIFNFSNDYNIPFEKSRYKTAVIFYNDFVTALSIKKGRNTHSNSNSGQLLTYHALYEKNEVDCFRVAITLHILSYVKFVSKLR